MTPHSTTIQRTNENELIGCHDCGLVLGRPSMPGGSSAVCSRCGAKLFRKTDDTVDRTLALTIAGTIIFVVANIYPFLAMRIENQIQETNLVTGMIELYRQGMPGLASLVLMTCIAVPFIQLAGLIYLLLPMRTGRLAWRSARVFRTLQHLKPWSMMEVFMLGILVAMIKLAKMAVIIPGLALWAFMVLIFVLTAAISVLNPDDIWKRLPIRREPAEDASPRPTKLVSCHSCKLLCHLPICEHHGQCPRCEAALHIRKPNSLNRCWALVIAAGILYFPANLLPITLTSALGHEQTDTIMSGVIYFMLSGSWHIALVIFVASVFVPLMKLLILIFLLLSVRYRATFRPEDRTRLYRFTEAVGRWSMVDIFVVTILVALVQLEPLVGIQAGPGAIFFAAVVVITMFAAESFDPRLIWDVLEEPDEHA
jgi:paraquat-inducible protein A